MIAILLHIGQDISIFSKDIVAIIDYSTIQESESNQEFLKTAEEEGFLMSLTDKPHSFVVTIDRTYPISAITLAKRVGEFQNSLL